MKIDGRMEEGGMNNLPFIKITSLCVHQTKGIPTR